MKKITLFLVALSAMFSLGMAQTVKQAIEKDFLQYSKLIKENKIDEALQYVSPKTFEVIPEKMLRKVIRMAFEMPNIEFKIGDAKVLEMSDAKKIGEVEYVKFKGITPMQLKFNGLDAAFVSMAQSMLEEQLGKDKVAYDSTTGFFKMDVVQAVVAHFDTLKKHWVFVAISDEETKALLSKVLPEELLN